VPSIIRKELRPTRADLFAEHHMSHAPRASSVSPSRRRHPHGGRRRRVGHASFGVGKGRTSPSSRRSASPTARAPLQRLTYYLGLR